MVRGLNILFWILAALPCAPQGFAAPATPVVVAPIGQVATDNPEFVWQQQSDATLYRIYLYDRQSGERVHLDNHDSDTVCRDGLCRIQFDLNLGYARNHRFYLKAYNPDGYSDWARAFFHYLPPAPAAVSGLSPSGNITDAHPAFQWQASANATTYRLYVWNKDNKARVLLQNYAAAAICSADSCTVNLTDIDFPPGTGFLFAVRAYNSGGWSDWSDRSHFEHVEDPPPVVTTLLPQGPVTASSPEFQWQAQSGVTQYRLYVWNRDDRIRVHLANYQPDTICDQSICSIAPLDQGLPAGDRLLYRVRAMNSGGWNNWSDARYFSYIPANQRPVAVADTAEVASGGTVVIDVLHNDHDDTPLTGASISLASATSSFGQVAVVAGEVRYQHDGSDGFQYPVDSFTYTVTDVAGEQSEPAQVTVDVIESNTAPVALADAAVVNRGESVIIAILANDSDPDNPSGSKPFRSIDPATVQIVESAQLSGTVATHADGTVTYTHNNDTTTAVYFDYSVADKQGAESAPARVSISVTDAGFCPAYTSSPVYRHRAQTLVLAADDPDWEQQIADAPSGTEILLQDGEYLLDRYTVYMGNSDVTVRSLSGNRGAVIIRGLGYTAGENEGFMIAADRITIADITVHQMVHHAVSMKPGSEADGSLDSTYLYNLHLYDIGTQHIKGSRGGDNTGALVACSSIGYTSGGAVGDYNGGIDIHRGVDVVIRDNRFYNITGDGTGCNVAVPTGSCHYISAPAVYMGDSRDTLVERNIVTDSFRGISLGLIDGHTGGIVRNNFVYRSSSGDMGISIENSVNTLVEHNTVLVEGYIGPIEVRGGSGHTIRNNLSNAPVWLRDGAADIIRQGNIEFATDDDFVAPGDPHLHAGSVAIGSGVAATGVTADIDGDLRSGRWDVGADHFTR